MTSRCSSSEPLTVALAQIRPTVGDLRGNSKQIHTAISSAKAQGSQLVIFPELVLTGYPPEDLLLKPHFIQEVENMVSVIAQATEGIVAVIGAPVFSAGKVYNAALVLANGIIQGVACKMHLPNYAVFDEKRYFEPSDSASIIVVNGVRVGVTICEDLWLEGDPLAAQSLAGAELVVNLSASPYHAGRGFEREELFQQQAYDHAVNIALCNMVGGQDELVFDGQSLVIDHQGKILARASQFSEELMSVQLDIETTRTYRQSNQEWLQHKSTFPTKVIGRFATTESVKTADLVKRTVLPETKKTSPWLSQRRQPMDLPICPALDQIEEIYTALVCGLYDYCVKNGFDSAALGLSGGIDSALVALLAVDVLGPENVTCVVMPSPYSSSSTQSDARELAQNLGVQQIDIEIAELMENYDQVLENSFGSRLTGLAAENLQARIRGNLLMAISNTTGSLVLTTGNKSELAVGYSTLYGDSAGGFAVIKDCPKLLVYQLVTFRNKQTEKPFVPTTIMTREPTAELRPDQLDSDSLPPYERLDALLAGYVEGDLSFDQLLDQGYDRVEIAKVIKLVDQAEYKRRQYPPGVRITPKAFGRDRRMPITNRYCET